jgi:uncharacterized protein (DUF362 family)
MKKPSASIVRVTDIESATREAISLIGGKERFVRPGQTVLIKPNLSWRGGMSTRSDLCGAIAKICLEAGAKKVAIGEGMLGESGPTPEHFRNLGYTKVADELGIPLVNLNECEPVEVEIEGARVAKKVKIAKMVLEADCLINVPIMKTHFLASVTLGLKNLKGCLSGHEKSKFHRIGLHRAIADLNLFLKPRLTVIDAVTAGEGMGPHYADEVHMGLLIASDDPLAADIIGASIMGYEPREVEHLRILAGRMERSLALADIRRAGVPVESVKRNFQRPPQELDFPAGVGLIQGRTLSGCIGSLAFSLFLFKKNNHMEKIKGFTFVTGRHAEVPEKAEKLFIVGNCALAHKDKGIFVEGCPPSAENLPYTRFINLFP